MTDEVVEPATLSQAEALDGAFAGAACDLVWPDGQAKRFPTHRWTGAATPEELDLFVDPCDGPTVDVGCGPGRLTAALGAKGLRALGLDISAEAVRLTRARGGAALQQDVLRELPHAAGWRHVLLADGNVGLGGDPVHLLRRLRQLLDAGGTMLVEVARPGVRSAQEHVRLRVEGQLTPPFGWATVGVDGIERVAHQAGMAVHRVRSLAGRHVATLGGR